MRVRNGTKQLLWHCSCTDDRRITAGKMPNENGSTPFGDIASPKHRHRSEPPSLSACAKAILLGPAHPTHQLHDEDVKTTQAAASLMMSVDEVYRYTEDTAVHKFHYPLPKLIVLGIVAGAYIGMGYSLCCLCAGLMSKDLRTSQPGLFNFLFGIYGFPMGLMLCVVAGADLFTSNCMYSAVGVWEGRFGLYGWFRMLFVSYFSNLVGALLLVGLMKGGNVFYDARKDFLIELALHKVSYPWYQVLCRGILGNWLVCLAVWQGNMGRDFAGRFIGVWLPDAAFVSMGLEHCIANQYLIPMSMALGSGISVGQFVGRNLIPATLGNLIGGSVLVATSYACSLGTPGHIIQDSWEHMLEQAADRWWRHGVGPGTASGAQGGSRGSSGSGGSSLYSKMVGIQLGKAGRRESGVPLKDDASIGTASHLALDAHTGMGILIPAERPQVPPGPGGSMASPRRRSTPLPQGSA